MEADDGYLAADPEFVKTRNVGWHDPSAKSIRNKVMARQETAHSRIKNFGALSQRFRHEMGHHQDVVFAVAVLVQLAIEGGDRLFSCSDYDDSMWI